MTTVDVSILNEFTETTSETSSPLYSTRPVDADSATTYDVALKLLDGTEITAQGTTLDSSTDISTAQHPSTYLNIHIGVTPVSVSVGSLPQLPTPSPNSDGTVPSYQFYSYQSVDDPGANTDPVAPVNPDVPVISQPSGSSSVYSTPNGGQVTSYVETGDGTSLSDIFSDGSTLAQTLSTGFENLSLIDNALGNAKTSRFVDSVAHALGAYDSLAADASAYAVAAANNQVFTETAENFATGAKVLGAAGSLFEIYEGVTYLASHPIDSSDASSIEAQQKLIDGSASIYGLINGTPGFGAAGALLSNAVAASEYASNGNYAEAAQSIAKGVTIFGFAGIGQLLDPEDGADIGAQFGGAAADLGRKVGEYTANNITDPILNTSLGQGTTELFYNTFLKQN